MRCQIGNYHLAKFETNDTNTEHEHGHINKCFVTFPLDEDDNNKVY